MACLLSTYLTPTRLAQSPFASFFPSLHATSNYSISLLHVFPKGFRWEWFKRDKTWKKRKAQAATARLRGDGEPTLSCAVLSCSLARSLLFLFIMPSHLQATRASRVHHLLVSGTSDIAEFRNQCVALYCHGLVLWGDPRTQCTDTTRCC